MNRRSVVLAAAVTAFAACAAFTGLPAHAASQSDSSVTNTAPMYATYVTKVLGPVDRNGDVPVLLNNGKRITLPSKTEEISVKYGRAQQKPGITPDNTINGPCGSSYITMDYKSNGQPVHMDTGFTVHPAAIGYHWIADEWGGAGTGYAYHYTASGDLDFHGSWHGQHGSSDDYPNSEYTGQVDTGSYAQLDDGVVCYSGLPRDTAGL